jgi:uncharacterized protein (DUF1499 family)/uncharacterized membrane protein (DUF485 family)
MRDPAIAQSRPKVSIFVTVGVILAVASGLTLLAAPIGYTDGTLSVRTAILTLPRWGAYLASVAVVVSFAGLIATARRPKSARRGLWLAVIGVLLGAVLTAIPVRASRRLSMPPIHDITTDTQNPPQYVAIVPLRAGAPNSLAYGGEKVAAQQRKAYPDIQPLTLPVPPAQAFERALAAVRKMGWNLVAADADAGRIEATDTTFWYRFKDDVVVRIRPAGAGSRIDVRSVSRIGGGDLGTNARRVRAYLNALKTG